MGPTNPTHLGNPVSTAPFDLSTPSIPGGGESLDPKVPYVIEPRMRKPLALTQAIIVLIVVLSSFTSANTVSASITLTHLNSAALRLAAQLTSSAFDAARFCSEFWSKNQMDTCQTSIPWTLIRSNRPRLDHILPTQNQRSEFVVLKYENGGGLLLTASWQDDAWRFSLDEKQVWSDFSADWPVQTEQPDFRYAQPVSIEQQALIKSKIAIDHQEITRALKFEHTLNVPFFFLNSKNLASDLSIEWPTYLSGGARDGLVLIIGNPTIGNWSVIFHELVHSYTAFPGEFWQGHGIYPNAMFSEGLATWFQMQKVWDDSFSP
jgi:hypothetical protein